MNKIFQKQYDEFEVKGETEKFKYDVEESGLTFNLTSFHEFEGAELKLELFHDQREQIYAIYLTAADMAEDEDNPGFSDFFESDGSLVTLFSTDEMSIPEKYLSIVREMIAFHRELKPDWR